MTIPLEAGFTYFEAFLLVLVRVTGLFVVAPIFGRRNIPAYYKVGFSFFLALIITNVLPVQTIDYQQSLLYYLMLAAKELLVGVTIGYVSYLVFTAMYMAGQFIDMQIGFGMVSVLDPLSNIQVPVTANLYFMISMLIFLLANGHHLLIQALVDSYQFVPIGQAAFNQQLLQDILRIFGSVFALGFKIAAPVITTMLITDFALGIMSRTIPQLNIFFVGMPLKIVLGILLMILSMPLFITMADGLINGMNSEMYNFIKDLVQKR